MKKLIAFVKTVPTSGLARLLKDVDLVVAPSKEDLIRKLVELTDVLAILVEAKGIAGDFAFFLHTLKQSFPVLETIAICDARAGSMPAGTMVLTGQPSPAQIAEACAAALSRASAAERRTSRRFQWPLTGAFSAAGKNPESFSVRSLSASGAFLECPGSTPAPGTKARLKVDFQNFSVTTDCVVLDPRQASSNLPSGFAVRFSGLSEQSREIIDQMIRNALMQALLNPSTEPEVPSLGDEELLSIGPELK